MFRSSYPEVAIPDAPLGAVVFRSAAEHPDRAALVDGVTGRVLPFGALLDRIRRVAAGLADRNFERPRLCL